MIRKILIDLGLIEISNLELNISRFEFEEIFKQKVRNDRSWQLNTVNNFQNSKFKYRGYILDNFFKITFETGKNSKNTNLDVFCEGLIEDIGDRVKLNLEIGTNVDKFKTIVTIYPLLGFICSIISYLITLHLISIIPFFFFSTIPFISLLFTKEGISEFKRQVYLDFKSSI